MPLAVTGKPCMHPFENILLVDGGEAGADGLLRRTVELALRCGARLTVAGIDGPAAPATLAVADAAPLVIERLALHGRAGESVTASVAAHGFDLVVKRAVEERGLLAAITTSVDEDLLRHLAVPLLLDRDAGDATFERILVAVDPLGDVEDGFAARLLHIAAAVAAVEAAELHVAHCWRLVGEKRMRGRAITEAAQHEVDGEVEAEQQRHATALAAALAGLPVPPAKVHVEKGPPAAALPRLVEALGVDLVVMGNAGRGGLRGLLVGNTAETVLSVLPCSLLVVREVTPP